MVFKGMNVFLAQFLLTALHVSWITNKTGQVALSITDLRVKECAVVEKQNQTELTCSTSCSLGSNTQYVWYKNGQPLQEMTTAYMLLYSTRPSEEGNYSCAVRGYEARRSPVVCAPRKQCWGVTYSSNSICALMGSSVDISCTYKYPRDHRVSKTFWFNKRKSRRLWVDLSLDKDYQNHTEYVGNKENSCTLRLKDMRESHSGEYAFRFTTQQGDTYSGLPGVNISVTALQVVVTPAVITEGERVTLTCSTSCTLSDKPTFIWYKNSVIYKHANTSGKNLYFNPVRGHDSSNYSCAVKGHKSLSSTAVFLNVRYLPKSVSASLSPFGEIVEGSSVTLTCSSDANPPVHNYTWHFSTTTLSMVKGTGESLSFNVTPVYSGLYHCEARNEIGSQNSNQVSVFFEVEHAVALTVKAGIILFMILAMLALGIVCARTWKAKSTAGAQVDNTQSDLSAVYSSISARPTTSGLTQRAESHDQGDVQYASVHFRCAYRQEGQKPEASATGPEEDCIVYSNVRNRSQL
ncbi:B-cell receptor CD22-like isoform X2 [Clupea harengus]|uniref:B-cell receptor CD22-like isoform X2 n=1 Tax=Clupea harengus TaxID=7950 RepID=A0A6P8F1U8_CLUHA|nr:B-cell receptor CD22-like isoform X2 [Clupea harengus]